VIDNQTQKHILDLLKHCNFNDLCDTYFADDFLWTIKGTSILSGEYYGKEEFFTKVLNRLNNVLLPEWKIHILNSYVDNNAFIIEMRGEMKAKNSQDYNNEYCWIFKFANNKIINVTAYYDSLLVNKTLNENEVKYE
jgi:ketosteroid isomerase-like protein